MARVWNLALAAACLLAVSACGKGQEKAETPEANAADQAATDAASAALATSAPPARKPGLWEQTISSEGANQTVRLCLDAATDRQMSMFGVQATQDMCQQQQMTKTADGWSFRSVCDMGTAGKSTSTGTIKGDFSSRYVMEATTETSGAGAPQMNGARTMRMEVEWKGPCPADMKPGDMDMNGFKVNIADLNKTMAGAK